jgi:hypothetical protein
LNFASLCFASKQKLLNRSEAKDIKRKKQKKVKKPRKKRKNAKNSEKKVKKSRKKSEKIDLNFPFKAAAPCDHQLLICGGTNHVARSKK